ncbi:hypothetical protein K443DRAFT_679007 [Laccaria amethystina LaAM-08-1]|uniref:Uncharacterized protein n=1 Tax=Laccaria amethystina LaAM-08-1 TaxID=1095629 RepID=A0A0C9WQL7_9AGAR|nr:hypothetical protein K443DRAFT_679007 [Laccaria amethystina LaAM-08-1]
MTDTSPKKKQIDTQHEGEGRRRKVGYIGEKHKTLGGYTMRTETRYCVELDVGTGTMATGGNQSNGWVIMEMLNRGP